MKYRKSNLSDVNRLAELRVAMLNEETPYPASFNNVLYDNTVKYIENGLADNSFVSWVAISDDSIIAMGCVNFFALPPNDWCPNGKTAYIGNMYTSPDFRKQGVATRLLASLIDEAKNNNCERILLNTSDMGRSLYEKYGFEESPTAMAFFPFGIKPVK